MASVAVASTQRGCSFCSNGSHLELEGETQTYVLLADDNYMDALKVSLYSLIKHTEGTVHIIVITPSLSEENQQVVSSVMQAAAVNRQGEARHLGSLSLQILKYNRQRIHCQGAGNNDGANLKKSFINAKISLIKNLMEKQLNGYENLQHFMWLDSDILVRGNVTQLYKQCWEHKGVAVASSNLFFVRGDLSNASPSAGKYFNLNFGGIIGQYNVPVRQRERGGHNELIQTSGRVWQTSGGVLFFNLPKFRNSAGSKQAIYNSSSFFDEEQWMDGLVEGQSGALLALSPKFNFRPTMYGTTN